MEINQEEDTDNRSLKSQGSVLDRLDNLPFGSWHLFMSLALGLVWIFDGYEVTLISLYRNQIEKSTSESVFKSLVSAYQIGGIVGSLVFGIMSFIIGRRQIFFITLLIYFVGVIFSGVQTNTFMFVLSRFLTGLSVGGQFTAIFTAVDQFLPPLYRGRVNIGIDGTWHLGGTLASVLTMIVGETEQWRLMFLLGLLGISSLILMRRNVPESPRWLILKKREQQAVQIIQAIQEAVYANKFSLKKIYQSPSAQENFDQQRTFFFYLQQILSLLSQAVARHTKKFIVSFTLIFTQALFFNLVYYQYPSILSNQFNLSQSDISLYMLPLSIISFLSTLLVGPYFDKIGRRKLLLITYGVSGLLLVISYEIDDLLMRQMLIVVLFVFASPASSSANLIASEVFPTSSRTILLFVMFIVSMLGGMCGVWFDNYLVASIMMIFAGVLAFLFCPNSQNKTLEQIEKL